MSRIKHLLASTRVHARVSHSMRVPLSVLAVFVVVAMVGRTTFGVIVTCNYIADGCDFGIFYSVERLINTHAPFTVDDYIYIDFEYGADVSIARLRDLMNAFDIIDGYLALKDYHGEDLTALGNSTTINGHISVSRATQLTSLKGLSGVTANGFLIRECELVESIEYLPLQMLRNSALRVLDMPLISDLSMLSAFNGTFTSLWLRGINATALTLHPAVLVTEDVVIEECPHLESVSNITFDGESTFQFVQISLYQLPALVWVGGFNANYLGLFSIRVVDLPRVQEFHISNFNFTNTNVVTSRFEFANVAHVDFINGTFYDQPEIFRFDSTGQRHFDGLDCTNITTPLATGMLFRHNPYLASLSGLRGLGNMSIDLAFNSAYWNFEDSIVNAGMLSAVVFQNNSALTTLDGLQAMRHIFGELVIRDNAALTTLSGLESVTNIHDQPNINQYGSQEPRWPSMFNASVDIRDNPSLQSIHFPKLTTVMGDVRIEGNAELKRVSMPRLGYVDGYFVFVNNSHCMNCSDVAGLEHDLELVVVTNRNESFVSPCIVYADACAANPCQNGGTCIDAECDHTSFYCNCSTAVGWPMGALCNATQCGDGVVAGNETCDDGNVIPGDGCESDCTPTVPASSSASTSGNTSTTSGLPSTLTNATTTSASSGSSAATATTSSPSTSSSVSTATSTTTPSTVLTLVVSSGSASGPVTPTSTATATGSSGEEVAAPAPVRDEADDVRRRVVLGLTLSLVAMFVIAAAVIVLTVLARGRRRVTPEADVEIYGDSSEGSGSGKGSGRSGKYLVGSSSE